MSGVAWIRRFVLAALVAWHGAGGLAAAATPTGKAGAAVPAANAAPAVEVPAGPPLAARQDWWLMGGVTAFTSGDVVGYRAEAGKPVPTAGLPGLRLLMVLYFNHWSVSAAVPGLSVDMSGSTLAVFPSAQYEVFLTATPVVRITLLPELGLGPAFVWIRMPDFPFNPAHYETHYVTVARLAGALQLATSGGLLLALQPAAGYLSLQGGSFDASYELGVRVGYQFP